MPIETRYSRQFLQARTIVQTGQVLGLGGLFLRLFPGQMYSLGAFGLQFVHE